MSVPRGCWVFLYVFCFAFLLTKSVPAAYGQGARVNSSSDDAETDRDDPVGRDLWFMRGRIAPPGQSAAALRLRADQQKLQMRAARRIPAFSRTQSAATSGAAGPNQWSPLGPAPLASDASGSGQQDYGWVSGRATSVVIDPADNTGNTVYLGGAFGGLWRSQNAGNLSATPSSVTWTPLIDNQPSLAVGAIALQPGNVTAGLSNVILVGTGEANSSGDSYYGLGILRSADAGATWSLITSDSTGVQFKGVAFSKIAFSTTTPNLVVAAAATSPVGVFDGARQSPDPRGIYVSSDGGVTWARATIKDGATTLSQTVSIISVAYHAGVQKFFAAVRYHGFYASSDGATWTRLTNQPALAGTGLNSAATCPTTLGATATCPFYRGEIAVVPGRNEMYVWYVDPSDGNRGIWRSTDGGGTWARLTDSGILSCGDPFGCGTAQGAYNLELAAVPNGALTDVYAGAINLFKCSIPGGTNPPLCNQASPSTNRFVNLTHVYGCSAIAKVHPDQHGVDFMVAGGKAVMYFANDGGIYRALDGYTGLSTGTCGLANSFDSLNQTLGSMTQFVSFSQHPTSSATILGGTQDNGSPASAQAGTSQSWLNVNGGDGGYNEINPNNPTEWFAANTRVSIQSCPLGINCHSADFPIIVSGSTLGGDVGPFYTPYILDPQNSGTLLVGTCRVWRGPTTGGLGNFTALSNNFDSGVGNACTGREVNLVHAVAAWGPTSASGSEVVYAVTEGLGPQTTSPIGGRVLVSKNATNGPSAWQDVTSFINPGFYTIGSVAVDTTDGSAQTAFVGIMGFGVSHVWRTTSAGQSWTDFTGSSPFSLPDAPVNSLLVDPATALVYAGTDVGVFVSSTSAPSWTEVGPSAQPGNTGYLPNVPVTKLRMFSAAGVKWLRASTYGRGVWQFPLAPTPEFQISVSNPSLVTSPGQAVTYSGTLTALDGYNKVVNLACTAAGTAPPPTCSFSPPSRTPTAGGAPFTLTAASNTIKIYDFNITGTDATLLTHTSHVTLTVNPDFSISNASGTQTVQSGQTAMFTLNVAPVGAATLANDVTYSCSGLPALTSCAFNPTQVNAGSAATPVTLTVSTTGPNAANIRPLARLDQHFLSTFGASLLGLIVASAGSRRRRAWKWVGTSLAILPIVLFMACGGGGSSPPPPPPVSVSISPASGVQLFPGRTQKFTATVSNSSNTQVNWQVNNVAGGDTTNGTVDTTGLYTAPAAVPNPANVTVKAVAQADATKSAVSSVAIKTPTASGTYTITITATSAGVAHNTTATFIVQ